MVVEAVDELGDHLYLRVRPMLLFPVDDLLWLLVGGSHGGFWGFLRLMHYIGRTMGTYKIMGRGEQSRGEIGVDVLGADLCGGHSVAFGMGWQHSVGL
jgi:hypothetical protein